MAKQKKVTGQKQGAKPEQEQEQTPKADVAAQAAALKEVVQPFDGADGKTYMLTKLDAISHQWRQTAVKGVQVLDPKAYAEYRKIKYANGDNPDLATRKKAYAFIVQRFLELSYNIPGA